MTNGALLKGLSLLEHLARSREPKGVTELARELGMAKSNVHRILQSLVSAGYIRTSDDRLYECTLKIFELSNLVLLRIDVRRIAEPFMRKLADSTRETIHLSVIDKTEIIYLHKIDSPQPVRIYSTVGGRAPAHCAASGKALIAYQEQEFLPYFSDPLPVFTPRTIRTVDQLRKELEQIRIQGFSINNAELVESVCGLAAVIHDGRGRPIAAIAVSGPIERLPPPVLRRYSEMVMEAARGISRTLGYDPVALSLSV